MAGPADDQGVCRIKRLLEKGRRGGYPKTGWTVRKTYDITPVRLSDEKMKDRLDFQTITKGGLIEWH